MINFTILISRKFLPIAVLAFGVFFSFYFSGQVGIRVVQRELLIAKTLKQHSSYRVKAQAKTQFVPFSSLNV